MTYVLKDFLGESCFGVIDFRRPIEEAADLGGKCCGQRERLCRHGLQW